MATIGKGNAGHLQSAILKNLLKLNVQFVHFDGGAPAFAAVVGGHVECGITGSVGAVGDVVNAIAMFNETREPLLPNVPTMKELGYPMPIVNQIVYANTGPGLPADRVAKLQDAFIKALNDPTNVDQQKRVNISIKVIPGGRDADALEDGVRAGRRIQDRTRRVTSQAARRLRGRTCGEQLRHQSAADASVRCEQPGRPWIRRTNRPSRNNLNRRSRPSRRRRSR